MTPDLTTLIASPHFRWLPGMRALYMMDESGVIYPSTNAVPDLADPSTVGCLLALVRELWGDPGLCAMRMPDGRWSVRNAAKRGGIGLFCGVTEGTALVSALLAAE